jgi:hypothetical protein
LKDGTSRESRIGSPSNQAKRNAKVLKDYILESKKLIFHRKTPHIWINAILVFTNPRCTVEFKKPTVDIVELNGLSEHIKNFKTGFKLSKAEIDAISYLLYRS